MGAVWRKKGEQLSTLCLQSGGRGRCILMRSLAFSLNCECVHTHAIVCMWQSEDNSGKSVLSYQVGLSCRTWLLRCGNKHLGRLSYLAWAPSSQGSLTFFPSLNTWDDLTGNSMVCILGNFNLVKFDKISPRKQCLLQREHSLKQKPTVFREYSRKISVHLVRRSKKPISSFFSFKHSLVQPILASNSLCS